MIIVADASVAVKWYTNEIYADEAGMILDERFELHAPELMRPEFANTLWKKVRQKELNMNEASRILDSFTNLSIIFHRHQNLLKSAFTGAALTGQTVYDWMYLALAVSLSCRHVTADERFYTALSKTSIRKNLLWIGDL